ncbi:MAG: hypothetical protein KGO51_02265 [Alphaproteobacteria bacterium]|nr:hypothetical protein [Alphaproteobacteria bacterium]
MQQAATAPRTGLQYQRQDSALTLDEGLAEYYAANLGRVTRPADLPPKSAALFKSHDTCHVIFGLSTTLADETMADTRTLLSCDVGWRRYTHYLRTDAQAKALFAELGWARVAGVTLACLPRIARAAIEALRTRKRWPWVPPEGYGGRSLADLRREYRIRVI